MTLGLVKIDKWLLTKQRKFKESVYLTGGVCEYDVQSAWSNADLGQQPAEQKLEKLHDIMTIRPCIAALTDLSVQ